MVSDQTGLRKPERRAFQCALDTWCKPPDTILCVDDNEANLVAAAGFGMATLLADPTDRWDRHVDRWIERQRLEMATEL
jgi:FMN phosphatase YigB (HAD superfamily)